MDLGALAKGLALHRRCLVVCWLSAAMTPAELDRTLAMTAAVCHQGAVVGAAFRDRATVISLAVTGARDLGYSNWVLELELRRMLFLEALEKVPAQ